MKLPNITLSSESLSCLNDSLEKEWLITNGLGGYSSSTVLGLNTRKYHGLLVATLNPPGKRTVCLANLDETLITKNKSYDFGTHEFHGSIDPKGHLLLKEFAISPNPTFTYQTDNFTLKKTFFMPYKSNSIIALYNILNLNEEKAKLQVSPLMSFRHIDAVLDRSKKDLNFDQKLLDRKIILNFEEPKAVLSTYATSGMFIEKQKWLYGVHYREENLRGELDSDDCYYPGYYEFDLNPENETHFAISATVNTTVSNNTIDISKSNSSIEDFEGLFKQRIKEDTLFVENFYKLHKTIPVNSWLSWILLASNSFVVQDFKGGMFVIAGYFWFESWGRDTFISLPGLMLVTERFEEAKKVLLSYSNYYKKGLIPNLILDETGQPQYNTVDATLWYVNAVFQYLKYTGDFQFIRDYLWEMLKSIIENHEAGTEFDIHLDNDNLLSHGIRLTWMDAYRDHKAVTPREGKAVEIQALWYNTLRIMHLLANHFNDQKLAQKYWMMSQKTKESFLQKYWNPSKNCLFDVIEKNGPDTSLRPNQILAVSLDYTMLDQDKNRKIVDFVQSEFLTPCGLRTLSQSDPRYMGIYNGIMRIRDQAYHNGAVWPWLLGPFIKAYLKAWGNAAEKMEFVMKNFVQALFEKQIYTAGLGTISEIFDGDPPHKPRACISQAWSVAEPLRAYIEDVLYIRPKHEQIVLNFDE